MFELWLRDLIKLNKGLAKCNGLTYHFYIRANCATAAAYEMWVTL